MDVSCPSPELLAAMTEGRLDRDERERLLDHLTDCDDCRHAVLVLAQADRATARVVFRARSRIPWAAAAAVVVLALAGVLLWRHLPRPQAPEIVETPLPPPSSTVARPPGPFPPAPPETSRPPQEPPTPPVEPPKPEPVPPTEQPKPEPPGSDATPPPPPPKPPTRPEPARELAAVRLLDVMGEMTIAKKRVTDGQLTGAPLTAVSAAAFRVDGDLVALTKGTVATVARIGEALSLAIESGEACVESDGARWLLGERALALKGRAIVSASGVALVSELPEKEAAKRLAPYRALRPRQRTWLFEDFADREGGVLSAAGVGPLVTARVAVPRAAPYGRQLSVRVRYRTNAPMLQVGMEIEGRLEPWAAVIAVKRGAWQELVVPVTRFEVPGVKEPPAGAKVVALHFSVNPQEVAKERAFLDLDDIVLIERE